MSDTSAVPRWEQRFRAPRHTLPAWAKRNPERCVFVSDASGTREVYAWDRAVGTLRQVTQRTGGTIHCAIESSADWAWWFADTAGDELGVWMRQPFEGGPGTPVAPDLTPAWPAGLAIGLGDHVLIGQAPVEGGVSIHLVTPGVGSVTVYRNEEPAVAIDLSRDLRLIAIEHSEHGDARNMAVRVLRHDGQAVADLHDEGLGFQAVGFAPRIGDARLLLLHERRERWEPLIWDLSTLEQEEIDLDLPGEVDVDWFQDASALLVQHKHHARIELCRYDLKSRRLGRLNVPPGVIEDARARPDGSIWYLWSDAATPPIFASTGDEPGLILPGSKALPSVPVEDLWVAGPGGDIHSLVSLPVEGRPPYPTIFLLHGGPDDYDADRFDPEVAAWVDQGFAVVRVNYRGSEGYGSEWTDALRERVGLIELEDVAAVREAVVRKGLADAARLVLAGSSWGGYLTLLGLGTQLDAWALGLAETPIADYVGAYEEAMDDLKAFDRSLFGGSPKEVPDRYRASSPLTYVEAVRAPVFISAGLNDPRCPIHQVENYVARMVELDLPHEVYRYRAGHGARVVDDQVELFRRQLAFTRAHLP